MLRQLYVVKRHVQTASYVNSYKHLSKTKYTQALGAQRGPRPLWPQKAKEEIEAKYFVV